MAAAAASSRSTASSGEWLMPLGLRVRTMAAGIFAARMPASWPAKHVTPCGIAERGAQPAVELDAVRARRDGQLGAGGQVLRTRR